MLKTFRTVLFWSHLVCGVVAGAIILIMCVTGVALTYQKEMQWWADTRHYLHTPAPGATRASVEGMLASVRAFDPEASPATIAWRAEADAPVVVAAGARTLHLNVAAICTHGRDLRSVGTDDRRSRQRRRGRAGLYGTRARLAPALGMAHA